MAKLKELTDSRLTLHEQDIKEQAERLQKAIEDMTSVKERLAEEVRFIDGLIEKSKTKAVYTLSSDSMKCLISEPDFMRLSRGLRDIREDVKTTFTYLDSYVAYDKAVRPEMFERTNSVIWECLKFINGQRKTLYVQEWRARTGLNYFSDSQLKFYLNNILTLVKECMGALTGAISFLRYRPAQRAYGPVPDVYDDYEGRRYIPYWQRPIWGDRPLPLIGDERKKKEDIGDIS